MSLDLSRVTTFTASAADLHAALMKRGEECDRLRRNVSIAEDNLRRMERWSAPQVRHRPPAPAPWDEEGQRRYQAELARQDAEPTDRERSLARLQADLERARGDLAIAERHRADIQERWENARRRQRGRQDTGSGASGSRGGLEGR